MEPITTAEAAKKLGVSQSRVVHLIHAGRLKAKRVGPIWLIDPKDLKAVRIRQPGRPRKDAGERS